MALVARQVAHGELARLASEFHSGGSLICDSTDYAVNRRGILMLWRQLHIIVGTEGGCGLTVHSLQKVSF